MIINYLFGFRLAEELDSFKSALEKKRERSQSRKRSSQGETSDTPREKRQKLDGPDNMGSDEHDMREIEERIAEQEMMAQEFNKSPEKVNNMKDGGEVSTDTVPGSSLVQTVRSECTERKTHGGNAMDIEYATDRDETECEMSKEVVPKSPSEQEAVVPQTTRERRLGVPVSMEFKPPRQLHIINKDQDTNEKQSNGAPLVETMKTDAPITSSQQSKTSLDELLDEGLPNQSLAYMMASQPQYALHDPDVTPPRLRSAATPRESCVKPVECDMIQSTQPQYHLMQDTDSDSDHHDKENPTCQESHVKTHFIGGDNNRKCVSIENQGSISMETGPAYTTDDQRVPGGSPPKPLPTQEEPESPTMYPKTPGMSTTLHNIYSILPHFNI